MPYRHGRRFQEILATLSKTSFGEQARRELTEPVHASAANRTRIRTKIQAPRMAILCKGNSGKEDDGEEPISAEPTSVKLARVTGIRHWAAPDYTA